LAEEKMVVHKSHLTNTLLYLKNMEDKVDNGQESKGT
jgi:hypothetical protein